MSECTTTSGVEVPSSTTFSELASSIFGSLETNNEAGVKVPHSVLVSATAVQMSLPVSLSLAQVQASIVGVPAEMSPGLGSRLRSPVEAIVGGVALSSPSSSIVCAQRRAAVAGKEWWMAKQDEGW